MARKPLTDGSIEFVSRYMREIAAHFDEPARQAGLHDQSLDDRRDFSNAIGFLHKLKAMGLVVTTPEPQRLDPDESPFTETVGGWESLFLSDLATWGSAGFGAASSVAEALMIANAIALAWGTDEVFYRGEHRYGHRLLSRAERK
jgi:hypothetical protein